MGAGHRMSELFPLLDIFSNRDVSSIYIKDVDRGCLLGGVCVPCINRMPGGVIVGDSGLCSCCVSVVRDGSIVRTLLIFFFLCVPMGIFSQGEIRVAFPKESQLQHSRATEL